MHCLVRFARHTIISSYCDNVLFVRGKRYHRRGIVGHCRNTRQPCRKTRPFPYIRNHPNYPISKTVERIRRVYKGIGLYEQAGSERAARTERDIDVRGEERNGEGGMGEGEGEYAFTAS